MKKIYQKLALVLCAFFFLNLNLFAQIDVSLKAFLEGPFDQSVYEMRSDLNSSGILILQQPFNQYPWFYEGNEQVSSIPNDDVIDWVLVELRETSNDASNAYANYRVAYQAGFVLKDGSIVAIDGISVMQFNITVIEKLFAVVHHRNHLPVISAIELTYNAGIYSWDFTSGENQAYGGADAQNEITPGIWGMISGDGTLDGKVNAVDKDLIWTTQAGTTGYLIGDFSMNSQVNNVDKNDYWVPNFGKNDHVPGEWKCGDLIFDPRDGQTYSTVAINTQCWMAENLNIGSMISGTQNMSDNGIIEKYCYDNIQANCDTSGGLYQWNELMQYTTTSGAKGICPAGWHLPTDAEWCTLEQEVDNGYIYCTAVGWRGLDGGGHLKDTGTIHWQYPNIGATNAYGFNALPGGYRSTMGNFNSKRSYAYWWYSEENIATDSWVRLLANNIVEISRDHSEKEYGFSTRCIWDFEAGNLPPYPPGNPSPDIGDTNIVINTKLSWSGDDPNHEPLTYNIYLGINSIPQLVQTNHPDTFYIPGYLYYDTTYFWKIVAYDVAGDSTSGPIWSFSTRKQSPWICGDSIIDFRDGQVYNTVKVGTQCWFSENLNIGTEINGGQNMSDNDEMEKYCYSDDPTNCETYGGLYQWDEVMAYEEVPGGKGICPTDWHIPTDEEWKELEGEIDSQYGYPDPEWNSSGWRGLDAGYRIKSAGAWNNNGNGSDMYGFRMLPAGRYNGNGTFLAKGIDVYIWSSSIYNSSEVWCRRYNYAYDESARYTLTHDLGLPARCIWDQEVINDPPNSPESPSPADGATGIIINTDLLWSCTDPDGDSLAYSIYLGETSDPPFIMTGHSDTSYTPGLLSFSTEYFWKVVAFDIYGDSTVGPIWSFTTMVEPVFNCGDDLIDYRDNQTYSTTQIGSQCWMAENLNLGTVITGSEIPGDNGIEEKYCYQDDLANCDTYGGLYRWNEMMNYTSSPGGQGICPGGWHIPTDEEWKMLEGTADSQYAYPDPIWNNLGWRGYDAGTNLKSTSGWYNNGNGNNLTGFNALPGGYLDNYGYYSGKNYFLTLWSSSEDFTDYYFIRNLYYSEQKSGKFGYLGAYSLYVRCLKD